MKREELQRILRAHPIPTLIIKPDPPRFTILFANDAYLEISGQPPGAFAGKGLFETYPENAEIPDHAQNPSRMKETLQEVMESGEPAVIEKQRYDLYDEKSRHNTERYWWSRIEPVRSDDGDIRYLLQTARDITEKVNARKRQSRIFQFSEELERIGRIGAWELDLEKNRISWSRMVKEIHEVPAEYEPELESAIEFYKKGSHRKAITEAVRQATDHGTPYDLELMIITGRGNERWVRVTGQCEVRENRCVRIFGVIQDITEEKLNRQELERSENRIRALLSEGADLITILNRDGSFQYVSSSTVNLLGLPPDHFIGRNALEFVHPDDRHTIFDLIRNTLERKRFEAEPFRIRNHEGEWRWMKSIITNLENEPSVGGYVVNSRDITESRHYMELDKLEREILEHYERGETSLEKILYLYLEGIESLHPEMICLIMYREANRLYPWTSLKLPPSFLAAINDGIPVGPQEGATGTAAWRKEPVHTPDIATSPLWEYVKDIPLQADLKAAWARPILDSGNEVMATLTVFYRQTGEVDDLEQRTVERTVNLLQIILDNHFKQKAYVEALNERATILERVSDAFFAVDREWTVTYWNSTAEKILEKPRVKVMGKNLWDEYPEAVPLKFYSEYHRAMNEQTTVHFEEFYPPLEKWFEVSAYPSESGLSVYFRDISDRKRNETRMAESLREKETLLAEIHHRVKNNLAIVSAMMQLQAARVEDVPSRDILHISVGRIKTMANIHEHLYRSESFSNLDFSKSLEHLVSEIMGTLPDTDRIHWECEADPVKLSINQAIPCSLITNEVITNTLKHAFDDSAKTKEVYLTLREIPPEKDRNPALVELMIRDNGRGLPDNFDRIRKKSLGLRLIELLSKQLKGEADFRSENGGTEFLLRFPKQDSKGSGNFENLS